MKPLASESNKLDVQFEVAYVNDDGSVGLHRVGRDGANGADLTIVTMQDLVQYKEIKSELF